MWGFRGKLRGMCTRYMWFALHIRFFSLDFSAKSNWIEHALNIFLSYWKHGNRNAAQFSVIEKESKKWKIAKITVTLANITLNEFLSLHLVDTFDINKIICFDPVLNLLQ